MPRVQVLPSLLSVQAVESGLLTGEPVNAQTDQSESAYRPLLLRPDQLIPDPVTEAARPGPRSKADLDGIEELAASMAENGQLQPILTQRTERGWVVIDGRRRLLAAKLLESRSGLSFPLACHPVREVFERGTPEGELSAYRAAIQANLKRLGYSPIQLAQLCATIRERFGYKGGSGTKSVAIFLGRSVAFVTQHEKLLVKPDGMAQETYDELRRLVETGAMGAESAFYSLTQLDASKVGAVLQKAEQKAKAESTETNRKRSVPASTKLSPPIAPRPASASGKGIGESALAAQKPIQVTKRHLAAAAKDLEAEKLTRRRTAADLLDLMQELRKLYDLSEPLGKVFHLILGDWISGKCNLGCVINECNKANEALKPKPFDFDAPTPATKKAVKKTAVKKRPIVKIAPVKIVPVKKAVKKAVVKKASKPTARKR